LRHLPGILCALTSCLLVSCGQGATPSSFTLSNGVRVVSVYFPGSTNVNIFSFLPMGLASDGPRQTQWSHLVEHLTIRATFPDSLEIANAETLPDHMRLDYYGNLKDWKTGLSHHRRWLEGVVFTEASLEAEKPRVKSEGETVARKFFADKFALAAWAQGYRHGLTNAAVQGDVDRATLAEIQACHDQHLAVLSNVVVCIVGGVEPAEVRRVVSGELAAVRSTARLESPVKLHPGNREMTWDLDARYVIIAWPIPGADSPDFAALLTEAQWLKFQMFDDPELKEMVGESSAGADLRTPEGQFYYLLASLRPVANVARVREKLMHFAGLPGSLSDSELAVLPMFSFQLAESLQTLPDLASINAQMPAGISPKMVEGNIGLQWGMNEFRYGTNRSVLAKRLAELKASDIKRVAGNYLAASNASVTVLRPK